MTVIPKDLRDALRARTVIPFVGVGVSMSVWDKDDKPLFPSWRDLLNRAADELNKQGNEDRANVVRAQLKLADEDYLEIAKRHVQV